MSYLTNILTAKGVYIGDSAGGALSQSYLNCKKLSVVLLVMIPLLNYFKHLCVRSILDYPCLFK